MKQTAHGGLKVDVLVESEHWKNAGAATPTVRRALKRAAITLSIKSAEVAIVLTDDAAMRRLNRNWRGINAPTNVLSFATKDPGNRRNPNLAGDRAVKPPGRHLGDIVLAYETVRREARREAKQFDHHLAHLAVHGFLHLLGYDHANDAQARRMETTERAILHDLAVPDPYQAKDAIAEHAGRRSAKRRAGDSVRERARIAQNA